MTAFLRSVTNIVGILLLLTAFSCFAQAQSASAEKPADLKALQDAYAKAIQKVESDSASAAQVLPATYMKELQRIQQSAKKAGDLEQLTAVNRELERFKTEQKVPDQPDASTPDAIKKLQIEYKAAVAKSDLEKNRKIVSATKQYLELLNSLQTSLTKNDKVNEALDVNAEIKRVKADSKVTSAEFALAASETDNQMPDDQAKKNANTQKSGKVDNPGAPKENTGNLEKGCSWKTFKGSLDSCLQIGPFPNAGLPKIKDVTAFIANLDLNAEFQGRKLRTARPVGGRFTGCPEFSCTYCIFLIQSKVDQKVKFQSDADDAVTVYANSDMAGTAGDLSLKKGYNIIVVEWKNFGGGSWMWFRLDGKQILQGIPKEVTGK